MNLANQLLLINETIAQQIDSGDPIIDKKHINDMVSKIHTQIMMIWLLSDAKKLGKYIDTRKTTLFP